jgi:hypothetical protein
MVYRNPLRSQRTLSATLRFETLPSPFMADKPNPSDTENRPATEPIRDDSSNNDMFAAAFRTLLIVLMLLGLPVIGILIYLNLTK